MLSTNALSVFLFHHHQNEICNNNLHLIQDIMCVSDMAAKKYKKVCYDFPNVAILTKNATPGEGQLTFAHAIVGNKSFEESVVAFALDRNLDSPSVVTIKMDIDFSTDGNKIHLPITEVILCAATGDLARSKHQKDWTLRNTVLLPPILTETEILNRGLDAGELLKIFS